MIPSLVQKSTRHNLTNDVVRNVGSLLTPYSYDYGRSGINLTEMERESTSTQHVLNINQSAFGTQMAYNDSAKNTMKQTTIELTDNLRNYAPFVINGEANTGLTDWMPKNTQKESTVTNDYTRPITQNDGMGYVIANPEAKTTHKESTLNINHFNNVHGANKESMVYSTYQDPQKVRYATHLTDYNGPGNYAVNMYENRSKYDNAEICDKKEKTLKDDRPNGRNAAIGKIHAGQNLIGEIKCTDNLLFKEREHNRGFDNISNINNVIPSITQFGTITKCYDNTHDLFNITNSEYNRFNGDIITEQLKNNPYYNLKRN